MVEIEGYSSSSTVLVNTVRVAGVLVLTRDAVPDCRVCSIAPLPCSADCTLWIGAGPSLSLWTSWTCAVRSLAGMPLCLCATLAVASLVTMRTVVYAASLSSAHICKVTNNMIFSEMTFRCHPLKARCVYANKKFSLKF